MKNAGNWSVRRRAISRSSFLSPGLSYQLDGVSIRVQDDRLIIAVTGDAWLASDLDLLQA